ncbi:DUF1697 domain-containing protein [Novosphingobium aquimarinum]|uniref:DUF1697 domain-containing protein n=1 Tax=Novosphingobium aquimarinum TaxID=2682494 RepID=UPI0012EBD642|nr:DUF1697 domain-containing protein [Novosphingobium aquimarinum]
MNRHVAFLSAINVGGNQLKMADLRGAMEEAGFSEVTTVVASGNVVFAHPRAGEASLGQEISDLLRDRFGIDSLAAVRTPAEVRAAIEDNPFHGKGEDKFVHTHFLEQQPSEAQFAQLIADQAGRGNEMLASGSRALYIDFVDGVGNSKLTSPFIAKRLGCRGTARNMRSLKRILEKLEG